MDRDYGSFEMPDDLDFEGVALSAKEQGDADEVLALWDQPAGGGCGLAGARERALRRLQASAWKEAA
ncbi:MAG TPA: hypothetical protein VMZ92_12160 [Planctomycetota bacterium]|nr:hypothetical protein [Planctomycetota bacterium]